MSSPAGSPESGRGCAEAGWPPPVGFAGLLAALVLAAFPQVILGLQTFVYRDFGYFSYPLAHHFRESVWRGEVPLWNPLNNCGLPFLAQWNTQVLYPPALFYVLFPLSWSLGVFCLAHTWLGGLGMYFLAQRWTGSRLGAGIAGVALAFNGLTQNCLMWPNNVAAIGWMPWVIWLVERAWRKGGRAILVAAFAGTLQMLAGAPEVILLTWVVLTSLVLGGSETPVAECERYGWLRRWVRFGLVVLIIGALSAVQLLPFLDLLAHSHRTPDFGGNSWSMPATGWANFLVPLFYCHPSFHGVYMQTGQSWTYSYYVGVPAVALALVAVWKGRARRVWILGALAVVFLIMALGDAGQLHRWLREHVAAMGLMRYPVKFVVLPVFVLPLLAAFGVAWLDVATPKPRRTLVTVWLLVVLLMATILWFAWRYPLEGSQWPATWQNTLWRLVFFTAALTLLAFSQTNPRRSLRHLLQGAAVVLVWLDLLTHGPRQQTVNREAYQPNLPRSLPAPRHGVSRAMVSPVAVAELEHSYIPNPTADLLSRRWTLLYDCNLLDEIPVVDGFFSLYLPEEVNVRTLLLASTNSTAPRLVDFLGVAMITSRASSFDWQPRASALPLVTAGQKPVFADAPATLARLASADFDPRREVFLPPEARMTVHATNASRVTITNAQFTNLRIECDTSADAPALVVIAQSFYHPWKAFVDGQPAQLWRGNHAFQAMEVPSGQHHIQLVYRDRAFQLGAVISSLSLLGCLILYRAFGRFRGPIQPSTA